MNLSKANSILLMLCMFRPGTIQSADAANLQEERRLRGASNTGLSSRDDTFGSLYTDETRALQEHIYEFKIDTSSSSMSHENTNDRVCATFYFDGESPHEVCRNGVGIGYTTFTSRSSYNPITHVVLETKGDNALFIDFAMISNDLGTIKSWGSNDDGYGWCLSTDADDGNGDWDDLITGCFQNQRFSVTSDDAVLKVNTLHGSISNEFTADTVCATFHGSSGQRRNVCKSGVNSDTVRFMVDDVDFRISRVTLDIHGDDKMFVDWAALEVNNELVKRWGVNGGRGWCMSQDAYDVGAWTDEASPDTCLYALHLLVDCEEGCDHIDSHRAVDSAGSSAVAYNPDWMNSLNDSTNLAQLSLPGTHDSMALCDSRSDSCDEFGIVDVNLNPVTAFAQCQVMNIQSQLISGIRAFDIRAVWEGNDMWIYHGPISMGTRLDGDILRHMRAFLERHPTETIFLRIKEEGEGSATDTARTGLRNILGSYSDIIVPKACGEDNLGLGAVMLGDGTSVCDARGKMIVSVLSWGSLGDDFTSFTGYWSNMNKSVQDNYNEPSRPDKWDDIKDHLELAAGQNYFDETVYINFLSASKAPSWDGWDGPDSGISPLEYAVYMHSRAINRLDAIYTCQQPCLSSRVGIVFMDFPGGGIIDQLIRMNGDHVGEL